MILNDSLSRCTPVEGPMLDFHFSHIPTKALGLTGLRNFWVKLWAKKMIYISLVLSSTLLFACSTRPTTTPQNPTPIVTNPSSETIDLFEVSEASSSDTKALGMTLHIQKKVDQPLVYLQLWLKAGTQLDQSDALGAAVLLQDFLMGDERDPMSLKGRLRLLGAQAKSWATIDRTVFEISMVPEQLQNVVKILAEHIVRPTWNKAHFEKAKIALLSKHLDARKWSGRRMLTRLLQQSFHGHPNGRLTLPSPEQVQKLTLEQVQDFYRRCYRPDRAHLVSVGSVNEELLREWVDEAWSSWESMTQTTTDLELPSYPSSKLRGPDVELEVVGSGYAQIFVSFPIPHLTPEGVAYLDLTSLLLVGDTDGSLYQAARRAGIDLKSARAFPITPDGPGALIMSFEVSPKQVDALWRVILEQLYILSHRPPQLRYLEQAKLLFERETIRVNGSLSSQARRLGFFSSRWPNANALARYGRALSQTRPRDLKTYLKDLISSQQLHALIRSPAPEAVDPGLWTERFREQALSVLDQRDLDFRSGFHVVDEQLSLIYEPSDTDGAIHLELTIPVSPKLNQVSELSLGHWLAAQMTERQPHEPYYQARFHDQSITIGATMSNSQLDEGLTGLIARIRQAPRVTEPSWSSGTLEQARQRAISTLELKRQQPWLKLRYLEKRTTFAGKLGGLPSPTEQIERLKKQGSASLIRWYQEHVQGKPALLVVSGDVEHTELSRALQVIAQGTGGNILQAEALRGLSKRPKLKRCRQAHMSSDFQQIWSSLMFDLQDLKPDFLPTLAILKASLNYPQVKLRRELNVRRDIKRFKVSTHENYDDPHLSVWVEASPEGYLEAISQLQNSLQTLAQAPLERSLFEDIKRFALSQQAHQLSSLHMRTQWRARMWFSKWKPAESPEGDLKGWLSALDLVTPAQLQELAQTLSFGKAIEVIWGPPTASFALKGCKKINL